MGVPCTKNDAKQTASCHHNQSRAALLVLNAKESYASSALNNCAAQLRNTKSLFPDINEVGFSSTIWIGTWTMGLKGALRPGQLLSVSNNVSPTPWRVIINHFSEQPVHLYLKIPNVSTIDDCWELDNYFQHPLINDLVYDTGRNCRTKESIIIMHRHQTIFINAILPMQFSIKPNIP